MPSPSPLHLPELSEAATAELQSLSNILHLLHHRSKNQHRRSTWYRHFSTFRRHLNHLLHELSPSIPSTALPSRARQIRETGAERAQKRLVVWREREVRRWWVGFSQIVADAQFAAIGVVLLAVLGKVSEVLGVREGLEVDAEIGKVTGENVLERLVETLGSGRVGQDGEDEDADVGTVVRREEVDEVEDEVEETHAQQVGEVYHESDRANQPSVRKTKRKASQEITDSSDLKNTAPSSKKPKKPKSKAKKGDAIDELFKGLF